MRVSPRLGSGKPLGSWRAEVAGLCVFRRNAGSSERAGGGVCPRPGYCLPGWRWRSWLSPCGWPPATVPIHAGFAADGQRRGGVARSMGSGRAVTARAAGWPCRWGGVFLVAAGQPSIRPGRDRRVTRFPDYRVRTILVCEEFSGWAVLEGGGAGTYTQRAIPGAWLHHGCAPFSARRWRGPGSGPVALVAEVQVEPGS